MNSLYNLLARHKDADKLALSEPSGRSFTYTEFFGLVNRSASALVGLKVKPGDRVAMQTGKSPEALALYIACVQTGAVFLPLNTAYTAAEISYFLDDSGAVLFVCDPELETVAREKFDLNVVSLGAGGSFNKLVANATATYHIEARSEDDLAAILYTSGTTGRSKGAMLSQKNLASNTEVLIDYWAFTGEDILLHPLPIYHTHGLFVASNVLLAVGGTMLFHPAFSVDGVIDDIPNATSMMGVPTFYTRLLSDSRFDRALAGHMRLFTSGSAPMLLDTHLEFEARTGQRILERYGMTETGMLTSNPYLEERKAGTVGFPLPGVELRVSESDACESDAAESDDNANSGDIGMIEVRGPNVFSGYWKMPEKTAEEFCDDGFFVTGDLGHVDADGYVTIIGRNKDLIITGGFNVYPKEVELLIDEVEGVSESAVIGLAHSDFGEAVTAAVVLETGADQGQVEASVRDHLASQLANFKQPKQYLILESLPRNSMGKVQKNIIREDNKGLYSKS